MGPNPIYLLFFAVLFHAASARCQVTECAPAKEDKDLLTRLTNEYQQRYKEELDKLPSKNHKDYVTIYGERWDNIKQYFDKEAIYTSASAQAYLDKLVAEIVRGNPGLSGDKFKCFFSRTSTPNAAYVGEGIILFDIGLFYRLDDEAEAAFVLCHEISHFLLRHPEHSMEKYVTAINSAEVQAELRRLQRTEYHKNEQLEKMVKGLTFDSRRHSRDHESQADSMAVELLLHTRFGAPGALRTLAILDTIDADSFDIGGCLQQTFNAPNYPFQKKWIRRDEGLLGGHGRLLNDKKMEDSLKTHPDCQVRIQILRPMIEGRTGGASETRFVVDSAAFVKWKELFRYEAIEYAFASDHYSLSLFLTLEELKTHPGDLYLVSNVGRILNGIYTAQKGHTLSKVVDLPAPDYPPNYNLLLQFIQNLYLENIAAISVNYLNAYHPQSDHFAPFRSAYEKSVEISKL